MEGSSGGVGSPSPCTRIFKKYAKHICKLSGPSFKLGNCPETPLKQSGSAHNRKFHRQGPIDMK